MTNRYQLKPLADQRLARHTYAMASKAAGDKKLFRGVKEVQRAIAKGQKGLVVFGADVSPLDIISHLPVYCENNGIPYYFVPSRAELGKSSRCRGTSTVIMIKEPTEEGCAWAKEYKKIYSASLEVMQKTIRGIVGDSVAVGSK